MTIRTIRNGDLWGRGPIFALAGALILALAAGCEDASSPGGATGIQSKHGHVHVPPHGGTPVILGDEDFHLEFVHVPATGTLRCYVLGGHMDEFIRVAQPTIALQVKRQGQSEWETLELGAVATGATGETVGDTSQFEAGADWLKEYPVAFEGRIPEITVRGISYQDVSFDFPLTDY